MAARVRPYQTHRGLAVGSGGLAESRVAARCLAKYVGKALDAGPAGLHRYEVGQGFQPHVERITGRALDEVLATASARMGSAPDRVWDSASVPDWAGPHAVWVSWAT